MSTRTLSSSTATPLRRDPVEPTSVPERLRHLRVVRPGERRRQFRLTPRTGVTLTVGLFAGLFAVAMSHALLIGGQARLDSLDAQVAEEQARYEALRRDVAELESPDRIVADATAQGMVPPADTTWLTPERSVDTGDAAAARNDAESTETSWTELKPYIESTSAP